jgi:dTDP-4-dehydrorhamnose 3,5-epimerase
MNFQWIDTPLEGVKIIQRKAFSDNRGFFSELYRDDFFKDNVKNINFLQDNFSFSKKGVLRGLHFQKKPFQQSKLVSVLKGSIIDVAVNLKLDSKEFGRYVMVELSDQNFKSLYIPDYFAHGFYAQEDSYVVYKTSEFYHKESESGIIWNDKTLEIDWPNLEPLVSQKDLEFKDFKHGISEGDFF